MTTCSDGSLVTEDTPRDMGPAGRDGVSDETDSWTPVCSQRKKKRNEKRKKEATTNFSNKREILYLYLLYGSPIHDRNRAF